jgi:hypothetical protein
LSCKKNTQVINNYKTTFVIINADVGDRTK